MTRTQEPKRIVIFGIGKAAATAERYFRADTPHEVVGYAVDVDYLRTDEFLGWPVVSIDSVVRRFPPSEVHAFVAMGAVRMNQLGAEKYAALKGLGYRFVSYVHSSNDIYQKGTVGENCFILEGQTTNYGCSIGNNVTMWSGCHIGDDSHVADDCFLGAHVVINGFVEVGAGSYLGSNCTISGGIRLGLQSFIGANALIAKSTADRSVHVIEAAAALEIDSLRFLKLLRYDV